MLKLSESENRSEVLARCLETASKKYRVGIVGRVRVNYGVGFVIALAFHNLAYKFVTVLLNKNKSKS